MGILPGFPRLDIPLFSNENRTLGTRRGTVHLFMRQKALFSIEKALVMVCQGALSILVLGLGATGASTSTPMRTTGDSKLQDRAPVEPSILITQQSSSLRRFQLAQNDVRGVGTRTRRIRFEPGAVGTVVKDSVGQGSRTIYLLGARGRQTMTLNITSLDQNAVFDIQAPNGQFLQEDATSWSGELPLSGDYSVIVKGARGRASYTLEVTIR
jgi:hypothetical protein